MNATRLLKRDRHAAGTLRGIIILPKLPYVRMVQHRTPAQSRISPASVLASCTQPFLKCSLFQRHTCTCSASSFYAPKTTRRSVFTCRKLCTCERPVIPHSLSSAVVRLDLSVVITVVVSLAPFSYLVLLSSSS